VKDDFTARRDILKRMGCALGWVRGPWRLAAKFILVFVVFFLLQAALVAFVGGDRVKHYVERIVYPNLQQQAVYMVADLRRRFGDEQYLMNLSERLHIDFVVKRGEVDFATRADLAGALDNPERTLQADDDDDKWKKRTFRPPPPRHFEHSGFRPGEIGKNQTRLSPRRGGHFRPLEWKDKAALMYREPDFAALLVFDPEFYPVEDNDLWLLGGGTLLLLLFALLAIRRLLSPLQDLRRGISNMEQGVFAQPIASRSDDELGLLARAFNRMSERINEQFRQREQLLADISHELRSPLARMRVALEFLREDKVKHLLLEEVEDQERLLALLLDNARLGALMGGFQLNRTRFDLAELVQRLVAGYKEPRLQLDAKVQPIWIEADITLLPRVLTNLVDNALKYTSDEVDISLSATSGHLLLAVSDRGAGIPEEEHERVFTAFYRLDKSRSPGEKARGYGLGLSLCKRIIEAHKGEIGIDGDYTRGTRVWVRLPRLD